MTFPQSAPCAKGNYFLCLETYLWLRQEDAKPLTLSVIVVAKTALFGTFPTKGDRSSSISSSSSNVSSSR